MTGFITLADAKLQLRELGADEDVQIQKYIDMASRHVESETGYVAPVRSEEPFRFHCFSRELRLPLRPIATASVAIDYLDYDGESQAFTDFRIIERNGFNRIVPAVGKNWPGLSSYLTDTIIVTADVGYAEDDADCPEDLKGAVRLLVGHWFLHREAVSSGTKVTTPIGVDSLLAPYRPKRL